MCLGYPAPWVRETQAHPRGPARKSRHRGPSPASHLHTWSTGRPPPRVAYGAPAGVLRRGGRGALHWETVLGPTTLNVAVRRVLTFLL